MAQSSALQNAGFQQIYGNGNQQQMQPGLVNLQTQPNQMQMQGSPQQQQDLSTLMNSNNQSMSAQRDYQQQLMMQQQQQQQLQQMQYQQMLQEQQMIQGGNSGQFNSYSASMNTPQQVLLGGGGQVMYGAPPAQIHQQNQQPALSQSYMMQQSATKRQGRQSGAYSMVQRGAVSTEIGKGKQGGATFSVRRRAPRQKLPYYQIKTDNDQRKIIHKPWSRPMAAQHLAATKIQSAIRRFLFKKHMQDIQNAKMHGQPPPYHLLLLGIKKSKPSQNQPMGYNQDGSIQYRSMTNFTATQSLRQKFLTSRFNVMTKNEEQCMKDFCAGLIQATYKMSLTRRLFKYHRFAMYHIAAIQIQWAWRGYQERRRKITQKSKDTVAAEKIQNAWRAFTNIKIFNYYKDLINFKQKGEPMQLLKSINPAEAGLLDAASRCHIRFRLGGERFPPLIYYKIFAHGGIVDINAFAPRDYHSLKKEHKKDTINIKYDKPENDNHNGWYNRVERNGWRPISDKILTPGDRVEIETNEKPKEFHFIPQLRKKATAQQRRNRKIKWLRKLYRDAKNAELIAEQGDTVNQAAVESARFQKQLESLYENPFDDDKFKELEDENFEDEVNNLIEWCEDLDFDKYCDSWHTMATSAKPQLPNDDNNVQVLGLGLGDITIGLGPPQMALSQQLPVTAGVSQYEQMQANTFAGQNISTQNTQDGRQASHLSNKLANEYEAQQLQQQTSQMIGGGNSPIQNAFIASKAKEEIFLKNNLEYEQRLKTHLYQFEEDNNRKGGRHQSMEDSQQSDRNASRQYARDTPGAGDGMSQMANQPNN